MFLCVKSRRLKNISEAGVFQLAIGGGEPLIYLRGFIIPFGLVPNVTTSGAHLTPRIARIMKNHCGAVALSLEAVGAEDWARRKMGFEALCRAFKLLGDFDVPRVLQVTLSTENLARLPEIVAFALSQGELY